MRDRKTILLIEDDHLVSQALGQALAVENFHVVPAANRNEALRQVGQHAFDILLLDLTPRAENGWETLHSLTALQPNLPVVAMTARPEQQQPNSAAHGVDVLLEKPLNLSVLLQTLKKLAAQTQNARRQDRNH